MWLPSTKVDKLLVGRGLLLLSIVPYLLSSRFRTVISTLFFCFFVALAVALSYFSPTRSLAHALAEARLPIRWFIESVVRVAETYISAELEQLWIAFATYKTYIMQKTDRILYSCLRTKDIFFWIPRKIAVLGFKSRLESSKGINTSQQVPYLNSVRIYF
jgi:hypothetical protein